MVGFEDFNGMMKSLPRREVIQPDFLKQTRAPAHHILMRNAVRGVEASDIQPMALVPHDQDYSKSHQTASDSFSRHANDGFAIDPDLEFLFRHWIRFGDSSWPGKPVFWMLQDRVVRVLGPDGRPGFVVCDDSSEMLPADRSANAKSVVGTPLAAGTGAADRKELFRTGGATDGGLPAVVSTPVVASQPTKAPDGPKPKDAADWWPSAVPGW